MKFDYFKFLYFSISTTFLLLIIPVSFLSAQPNGKLTVQGGTVQLIVTSLNHYNNGVSLVNWTRLRITYTSDPMEPTVYPFNWQLTIRSQDTHLISDDPENSDLDLNYLKLVAINVGSDPNTTVTVNDSFSLSTIEQTFISGEAVDDFEINFGITYELGKDTPLLGSPWGSYYTIFEFTLYYTP